MSNDQVEHPLDVLYTGTPCDPRDGGTKSDWYSKLSCLRPNPRPAVWASPFPALTQKVVNEGSLYRLETPSPKVSPLNVLELHTAKRPIYLLFLAKQKEECWKVQDIPREKQGPAVVCGSQSSFRSEIPQPRTGPGTSVHSCM